MYDFYRAGIIDDVRAVGLKPRGVCWRSQDGTFLGGMGREGDDSKYAMVVLPLDRLGPLIVKHFESYPNTEIKWGHKLVSVEQDDNGATAVVETRDGEKKKITGDYLVGADGASSGVRTALFGKEYPGETLKAQIVATNVRSCCLILRIAIVTLQVYLPFDEKFGFWDSNFIVHPTDWYMAAKITNDGLWRVTYGDSEGLSKEELVKRQPLRYEQILPGHPKPDEYKLISMSPYKLQQRCAPSFRVGKIVLVADAAHLCNPLYVPPQVISNSTLILSSGGMGLTGGFADVGSLYDCFTGIHLDELDEDILDLYSTIRIKIWRELIDPVSRENFHRLWDPTHEEKRKQFFEMCGKANDDLVWGKQLAENIHKVRHDFTQYFKSKQAQSGKAMGDLETRNGVLAENSAAA